MGGSQRTGAVPVTLQPHPLSCVSGINPWALLALGVFWCHCLFHMRPLSLFVQGWNAASGCLTRHPYQGGASQVLLAGGGSSSHMGRQRGSQSRQDSWLTCSEDGGGCRGRSSAKPEGVALLFLIVTPEPMSTHTVEEQVGEALSTVSTPRRVGCSRVTPCLDPHLPEMHMGVSLNFSLGLGQKQLLCSQTV